MPRISTILGNKESGREIYVYRIQSNRKHMKTKTVLLLTLVLAFMACQTTRIAERKAKKDTFLYQQSIQKSMYPEASKVYDKLVPVVKQNQYFWNLSWL